MVEMNLKRYAIILSFFTALFICVIAFSSQGIPLTHISISKIGSLEGNYLFYLLSTSALIIMFSLFLQKIYETLGEQPRLSLYIVPILSVIALLFKAGTEPTFGKIFHTVLFVISGLLVVIVMYDLNKILSKNNSFNKKIFAAPKVAFFGTIIIFTIIGLNVITEIFYIGAVLSWMHSVSVTLSHSVG